MSALGGSVLLAYDSAGLLAPVTFDAAPGEPVPFPAGCRPQRPEEPEADYIAALEALGLTMLMWDFSRIPNLPEGA
ncbi:hypothetical protein [Azohydromonas lata]|uniref:Uncharacterized protein n=1 Tax=Azohydromonas lata TaxID=45677 RepID=A0ABU5IG01_9BURK|nr:hypothetical protein [Azohydromonas lata]MDZ5457883.1 hypothetical protein [Azohydromonas lata]